MKNYSGLSAFTTVKQCYRWLGQKPPAPALLYHPALISQTPRLHKLLIFHLFDMIHFRLSAKVILY
uniref:Uncharacterized protein n=5 Tax=Enterobacteriaceae TaxID=543 RepID=A0A1V0M1G7_CITFR|nr:Hypothetical protein [Leclercia adecarboxylata]ARD68721.1 Hypothetical protein [Citrobacter freundii]ARD69150.1 Hypothetical protein [Enterobacter cloacae]AUF80686.1 Hypothetical protein [Raoultella ornithinolytica]QMV82002.1 hypothetical protein [Leclercia sp.]URQ57149.1 Hypothetical protein [Raoultella planticola]UUW41665.1 hypothetical protein [Leclercia sp. 29361]